MVPTVISQKSFWHNFMLPHSQSGFGDECGRPWLSLPAVGLVISAMFVGYTSCLPPGIVGYAEHLNLFVLQVHVSDQCPQMFSILCVLQNLL